MTLFDKWMYALRNLFRLLERPKALQDRIFQKLFEQAEIAKYSDAERRQYEASQKEYWDYTSTLETAELKGERRGREEGRQEGLEQGRQEGRREGLVQGRQHEKIETVRRLHAIGLTIEQIAQGAGMEFDEVKKLLVDQGTF